MRWKDWPYGVIGFIVAGLAMLALGYHTKNEIKKSESERKWKADIEERLKKVEPKDRLP